MHSENEVRTEDDLRDAIDLLAAEGAYISAFRELRRSVPSARRNRRVGQVLGPAVAALVVVTVAVTGIAIHRGGSTRPTASGRSASLVWRFSVHDIAGYVVTRFFANRPTYPGAYTQQMATVTAKRPGKASGVIAFYSRRGEHVEKGSVTTGEGVRYHFSPGRHVARQDGPDLAEYRHPWVAAAHDQHGPRLTWRYADGSLFSVQGTFGFDPLSYNYDNAEAHEIMLRIARAVRPGQQDAVTAPFQLRSVPDHLVPVALDTNTPGRQNAPGQVGRTPPPSACVLLAAPHQPGGGHTLVSSQLQVCRVKPVAGHREQPFYRLPLPSRDPAQIAIRHLSDGTLLAVGDFTDAHHFTKAQLRAIVDQANVSPSPDKPETWLDVG